MLTYLSLFNQFCEQRGHKDHKSLGRHTLLREQCCLGRVQPSQRAMLRREEPLTHQDQTILVRYGTMQRDAGLEFQASMSRGRVNWTSAFDRIGGHVTCGPPPPNHQPVETSAGGPAAAPLMAVFEAHTPHRRPHHATQLAVHAVHVKVQSRPFSARGAPKELKS